MLVNPEDYVAEFNHWFEVKIQYEGLGRAEFENPRGWIEGPTKVSFDETGRESIEMQIENFHCEETLGTEHPEFDDIRWLLSGRKPHMVGNWVVHGSGIEPNNTCKVLRITSEQGTYETLGDVRYAQSLIDFEGKLHFFVLNSKYETNDRGEAEYWVMPLTNFVSQELVQISFPLNRHILDHHPLRIYKTASVPHDLPKDEQREALHYANRWNCFIAFKLGESLGFIERLLDYEERSERLLLGEADFRITSVMVGDCDDTSTNFDEAIRWLPLEYLHMLSLATGSLVGTPWIEFRDETGNLHTRLHTRQWGSVFAKGHVALDGFSHGGIGWLLSNAPETLDANLRTAIHLVVKGSQYDHGLDDQLAFLFRAGDTLTKEHRRRLSEVEFDEERQERIRGIVSKASQQIREIAKEMSGDKDTGEEKKQIERIATLVSQALDRKRADEAKALLLLLKDYGLHDEDAIPHVSEWMDRFNKYRNQVIHESYFELETDHPPEEFMPLYRHLLDILLRVILKKLNYDRQYRRAIPIMQNVSVDWVQPDTLPEELGYV